MTHAQERDLSYRPAPIRSRGGNRQAVTQDLQDILDEREQLRKSFMRLQVACSEAETDDAISVEAFADLDAQRDDALSELLGAEDDVLTFKPDTLADLAIIVAMARHHLSRDTDLPENFIEHLLSCIETLVLERRQ